MNRMLPLLFAAVCIFILPYNVQAVPTVKLSEENRLKALTPLIDLAPSIMFWRPQKVGSSTIVSLLASYGYRFNALPRRKASQNYFCRMMRICGEDLTMSADKMVTYKGPNSTIALITSRQKNSSKNEDKLSDEIPFRISLTHEVCNMQSALMLAKLKCAFKRPVKELLIVREPVDRAVSAYYFWGELFKMAAVKCMGSRAGGLRPGTSTLRLGGPRSLLAAASAARDNKTAVVAQKFTYHGDESSVPPEDVAVAYAKKWPYAAGMPGPSYTWSLFANSPKDALPILHETQRLMTLVTERLDESLVVMMHFLNTQYIGTEAVGTRADWGLGDLVYVTRRKSLSSHPKAQQWPHSAINLINDTLRSKGEYAMYEAATQVLDRRILVLNARGVNVQQQVLTLGQLRERVSQMCFSDEYLERYKRHLAAEGLERHASSNKLRDVEDKFSDGGHEFSLNREILYSFDVCGNCEAHAIMLALTKDLGSKPSGNSVDTATVLKDLPFELRKGQVQLAKCPQ